MNKYMVIVVWDQHETSVSNYATREAADTYAATFLSRKSDFSPRSVIVGEILQVVL